jgi:FKBP-type peptidyl-prolyl cis-trans isomerase
MKRAFCGILLFLGCFVFCSASDIDEAARKEKADMSYAFGMLIASDLADTGIQFDYDAFISGFRDTMENVQLQLSFDEAMRLINDAIIAAEREYRENIERNLAQGIAFLEENSKRPEVIITPSGLQYEVIIEGEGDIPGPSDIVLVHYHGTTIDGTVFDSTYDDGWPIEVPLDRVILGWAEGLRLMREGGRSKFYIPPNLAYGDRGGGGIGPNAVLVFDVELLTIIRPIYYQDYYDGYFEEAIE